MKHSSSGETQQEAYKVLPIGLAFEDMNLNYTFFFFFPSLVPKVGIFVFFLVSYVSVSLLIAPSVNRNVTLLASTFRIIRIILDTLVSLLFFLNILPSFVSVFIQSCFIISTNLHHFCCNLFISLLLLCLSFQQSRLTPQNTSK